MAANAEEIDSGRHKIPLAVVTPDGDSLSLYTGSYALLIGSSRYKVWPALSTIPAELDELESALSDKGFAVTRLVDPDSNELEEGIQQFIDDHGYIKENRLLIYFSGHGYSTGDKGFLVPVDAPLPEELSFRRKVLPMSLVLYWAREMEAKHVLFMFDSCFSGTVFKSRNLPKNEERYIRNLTAKPVRQFITAGSADQAVPAKSTFTPALVNALRGAGDLNKDGYVTGSELGLHLSQLVPLHVENQTPQYGKISDYHLSQGDFVFFLNEKMSSTELLAESEKTVSELSNAYNLEPILWVSTEKANTIYAYSSFLKQFPDGVFGGLAKEKLRQLTAPAVDNVKTPIIAVAKTENNAAFTTRPKPRPGHFDLNNVAAEDIGAIRRFACSRDEAVDADEIKREASAVFFGKFDHAGSPDEARGWELYLEAIAHCSTSALVEIAKTLQRKDDCAMALEYAQVAVENGHLGARRLVGQIKRSRSCSS